MLLSVCLTIVPDRNLRASYNATADDDVIESIVPDRNLRASYTAIRCISAVHLRFLNFPLVVVGSAH